MLLSLGALAQLGTPCPLSPPSQMDAGTSVGGVLAGRGGMVGGELLTEASLLAPASLPAALRDVLVDITELQPLRWPNGALHELGTGARWAVGAGRAEGRRMQGQPGTQLPAWLPGCIAS